MRRWFIADTHFGHEGIIRGMLRRYPQTKYLFPSVEAHDEYMIRSINAVAKRDDELWILGDFAWKTPGKYRMCINCKRVRLIRGNHDAYAKCKNVFGEVPYVAETKLRREGCTPMRVILSHCPFAYWDGSYKGWAHLYGHIHGQREETLYRAFGPRRAMDVSADNLLNVFGTYLPVSEASLHAIFSVTPTHDPREFYVKFQAARDREFFDDV